MFNNEGSISEFKGSNSFGAFIYIYINNIKSIEFLHCDIPKPSKIENNYRINCFLYYNNKPKAYFDKVELSPYFYPKVIFRI